MDFTFALRYWNSSRNNQSNLFLDYFLTNGLIAIPEERKCSVYFQKKLLTFFLMLQLLVIMMSKLLTCLLNEWIQSALHEKACECLVECLERGDCCILSSIKIIITNALPFSGDDEINIWSIGVCMPGNYPHGPHSRPVHAKTYHSQHEPQCALMHTGGIY